MNLNLENSHNNQAREIEALQARLTELERRPKPIPPKPRKALPWPRAAVKMTYIVMLGLNLFAIILLIVSLVVN